MKHRHKHLHLKSAIWTRCDILLLSIAELQWNGNNRPLHSIPDLISLMNLGRYVCYKAHHCDIILVLWLLFRNSWEFLAWRSIFLGHMNIFVFLPIHCVALTVMYFWFLIWVHVDHYAQSLPTRYLSTLLQSAFMLNRLCPWRYFHCDLMNVIVWTKLAACGNNGNYFVTDDIFSWANIYTILRSVVRLEVSNVGEVGEESRRYGFSREQPPFC